MTSLNPCRSCPISEGCELKALKAAAIRGLGFTSAKFKCSRLTAELRPGRRVIATIGGGYYDENYGQQSCAKVSATVISTTQKGVLVWLDDAHIENLSGLRNKTGVCSLTLRCIQLLDQPDRPERVDELKAHDEAQACEAMRQWQ